MLLPSGGMSKGFHRIWTEESDSSLFLNTDLVHDRVMGKNSSKKMSHLERDSAFCAGCKNIIPQLRRSIKKIRGDLI